MLRKKNINNIILIIWTVFVFILLIFPFPESVGVGDDYTDKIVHIFLFGIFAYLLANVLINNKKLYLISFFASSAYVFLGEFMQLFIPERGASYFDVVFGIIGVLLFLLLFYLKSKYKKPSLLLHICCISCGAYISSLLKKDYNLTLYFYNPNIFPKTEFEKRLEATSQIAKKLNLKIIIGKYNHDKWLNTIKGHELAPERGARCQICYEDRLKNTARKASELKIDNFTTTLTISPHKDAEIISQLGKNLAEKYKINFLDKNFKKQNGFKKSVNMSKELGLYRQNYCGCEFSRR